MSAKKEILKNKIIKDIQRVHKLYQETYNNFEIVTRDFYREHGKYTDAQILSVFKNFTEARNESLKIESLELQYKKQIKHLQNENSKLIQENKELLDNTITEDTLLQLYDDYLNKNKHDIICNNNYAEYITTSVTKIGEIYSILMLSDFHLGEIVDRNELHNINEFNSEIFFKRLQRIFKYFIKYNQKFQIQECYILFLGDLFSGSHHPELMKTNEQSDVECIFMLQDFIISQLIEISQFFSKIHVHFVVGNHGRIPQGKPEYKKSSIMNYEYIFAKQIQMYFDLLQKNVLKENEYKIEIAISPALFDVISVAGRKFLITHGHILSSGSKSFAGIPYYGLSMSASKLDGAFKELQHLNFSDILCGHLHCTSKVKTPIGNIYINGSLIGVSDFALYNMKVIGYPEQTMLICENGYVNAELVLRGY